MTTQSHSPYEEGYADGEFDGMVGNHSYPCKVDRDYIRGYDEGYRDGRKAYIASLAPDYTGEGL